MSIPSATSLTLLAKVRSGDDQAWQRLFDIYSPLVFGRLLKRGLNEADAEEVVETVFAKVARSIDKFRRERADDSFLKWLQTITTNQLLDFYKHRKLRIVATGGSAAQAAIAETPDPFADEDWSIDTSAKQTVLKRALELMKAEFAERTWRAFWLYVIEGKETDQVCAELDMKPGAARQAKSKVRPLRTTCCAISNDGQLLAVDCVNASSPLKNAGFGWS